MSNTDSDRPAKVLLSALWALAAVLAIAAFAVSAWGGAPADTAAHPRAKAPAKSVESVTSSSMLRPPGHAISKDKLD